MGNDQFTTAYVRQGFPCGVYEIDLDNHDDAVRLYINNSQVYQNNGCCADRGVIWTGALGSSDIVRFVVVEGGGGARLEVDFDLVTTAITGGTLAGDNAICPGGDPTGFTNTVNASGGTISYKTPTFQWQSATNIGGPWSNIGGATAATYDPPGPVSVTTYYRRIITDDCGSFANSNVLTVTVQPEPSVSIGSASSQVCTNGAVTMLASPSNGTGTPTYQWQEATSATGPWVNTGSNNSSFNDVNLLAKTYYRVYYNMTGSGCDQALSNVDSVEVVPDPNITVTVDHDSICLGGEVELTALTSGGAGVCLANWEYSTVSSSGSWISLGSGGVITNTPASTGTIYYKGEQACTGNGCDDDEDIVAVEVVSNPTLTLNPDVSVTCEGVSLPITTSIAGGSESPDSYNWYEGANPGGPFTSFSIGGPDSLSRVMATQGFRRINATAVYNSPAEGCPDSILGNVVVQIREAPSITSFNIIDTSTNNPESYFCQGYGVFADLDSNGGTSSSQFYYEMAPSATGPWSTIALDKFELYDYTPSLSLGDNYVRVVYGSTTDLCVPDTTPVTQVAVDPLMVINFATDSINTCVSETPQVSGTRTLASTASPSFLFSWEESSNSTGPWSNASGASLDSVSVSGVSDIYYRWVIGFTGIGCNTETAILKVNRDALPSTVTTGADQIACLDEVVTLSGSTPASGTPRWRFTGPGAPIYNSGDSLSAAPAVTFTQSGPYQATYRNQSARDACPAESATTNIGWNNPSDISLLSRAVGSCQSSGQDEVIYISDGGGNLILGLDDSAQSLGLIDVTQYVGPSGKIDGKAYMGRHWVIQTENPPANPVRVILPFTDAELLELINNSLTADPGAPYATLAAAEAARLGGASDPNGNPDNDDIYTIDEAFVTQYSGPEEDSIYGGPGGTYQVHMTSNSGTGDNFFGANFLTFFVDGFSEFWIHGTENFGPLPVELMSFEATAINNEFIQLDWTTALELDNEGFEIHRSADGLVYNPIGWFDGNGNSSDLNHYQYQDMSAQAGITYYYKLRQVDFNGEFEFSPVRTASLDQKVTLEFGNFVPNPTSRETHIQIRSANNTAMEVAIYDQVGQYIKAESHHLHAGSNLITITTDELATGVYFARFNSAEGQMTISFVVSK